MLRTTKKTRYKQEKEFNNNIKPLRKELGFYSTKGLATILNAASDETTLLHTKVYSETDVSRWVDVCNKLPFLCITIFKFPLLYLRNNMLSNI